MADNIRVFTEEDNPQNEWFAKAKTISTAKDLDAFYKELFVNVKHDYATITHATSAYMLAVSSWLTAKNDISPLQTLYIMWDVIKGLRYSNNKCGMFLLDFDNMLKPKLDEYFDKKIQPDTWERLQTEAKQRLLEANSDNANKPSEDELLHLQSIVDGNIPYGYTLSE